MKEVFKAVLIAALVLGFGFVSSSQHDLAYDPDDAPTGGK